MESIEKCIVERALHEQEIQKRLKSGTVSEKGNANGLENDCSKTWNDQSSRNQSSTSANESNISGIKSSRSRNECSERYNLWNDTDICPSYDTKPMAEAPNFANYIVFAVEKQHTVYESYARNVDQHATKHENERVLLASSILKLKADIEANKEIQKDLKKVNMFLTQELDKYKLDPNIAKLILIENQVKFLSDNVYKTSQSAQTVHMLIPKPSPYYNGKCSIHFKNPEYLKKAQWEKLCLYNVQYDKNDLANVFAPESKETT
ncbi:hypothetical protein Tco_0327009 [Tanacetum coccineum]